MIRKYPNRLKEAVHNRKGPYSHRRVLFIAFFLDRLRRIPAKLIACFFNQCRRTGSVRGSNTCLATL